MKKINLLITLLIFSLNMISGQVAIGKASVDGSSILDFQANTTKGLILPAPNNLPASPSNGTLAFNRSDAVVYIFQNNIWVPLTEGSGSTAALVNNPATEAGNGVVMGATASSATGVLVLESSSLALTLPKVASPHLNMKSPYPGTICYDTTSNTIAVFDGVYWNFWK